MNFELISADRAKPIHLLDLGLTTAALTLFHRRIPYWTRGPFSRHTYRRMSALNRFTSKWKQRLNRRLYKRMPCTAKVFLYDPVEEKGVQGTLQAWSLGGVSFYAPSAACQGKTVCVRFSVPEWLEKPVTISGVILKKERVKSNDYFFVVLFSNWEEPDRIRLREALLNPRREFEYQISQAHDVPPELEP